MSDNEIREIFSKNLKYYLELNKKTQADLRRYMGVSSATASDWCNARKIPRRDNAAQIAALERKIGKLKDLYINELITLDEYRSDKESYIKQIESLHAAAPDEYGVGNLDLSALQEIISADIDVIYAGMSREEKRFYGGRSLGKYVSVKTDALM